MTTWPRMDYDPPGSWNGVVQTPLRKLWVQVQRVATSMRQVQDSSVEDRGSIFSSSRMRRRASTQSPLYPHRTSSVSSPTSDSSGCRYVGARAPGTAPGGVGPGALPRGVKNDPPGTPPEGGPGPPKKGGCRDTKQCKFWRVSSVLIQGHLRFLALRGGPGGCPGGALGGGPECQFWGVREGVRSGGSAGGSAGVGGASPGGPGPTLGRRVRLVG